MPEWRITSSSASPSAGYEDRYEAAGHGADDGAVEGGDHDGRVGAGRDERDVEAVDGVADDAADDDANDGGGDDDDGAFAFVIWASQY